MERLALRADIGSESEVPERPDLEGAIGATRRQRLKEATSEAHRRLDKSLMQQGYFSSAYGFGLYLRRMHEFHLTFGKAALASDSSWYMAWGLQHHQHWIETDLIEAGIRLDATQASISDNVLRFADRSSLAGALYVIAGSSLGARVLHRLSVERQLPGSRGSFYLSQLSASLQWSEFLRFLGEADIASEESMLEGATSTFACVSRHLGPAVPE